MRFRAVQKLSAMTKSSL